MRVERLGSGRHITETLLVASDAVLCAAMSLFFILNSPFPHKPPVPTLFYPFCLAQICQIIATNTWQQPRFTTSPPQLLPFFLSLSHNAFRSFHSV